MRSWGLVSFFLVLSGGCGGSVATVVPEGGSSAPYASAVDGGGQRIDCGPGAGTQAGSPWPMFGRCPSHEKRSPIPVAQALTKRWSFSFPSANQGGNTLLSSPSIAADGTIYVGSQVGVLYAVDPLGHEKWHVTTGSTIGSSPAIGADGTVFVGSNDHQLYAIHPDGSTRWTFQAGGEVTSPAIGADGTVYIQSQDGVLHAIDPGTGASKWAFQGVGPVEDGSPAIADDGTIYLPFYDGKLHAIGPDGKELWSYDNHLNIFTPAAVFETTAYFGGEGLFAVSTVAHGLMWDSPTSGSVLGMPAIGADGTVYFSASDGTLRVVDPRGTTLRSVSLPSSLYGPVVDGAGTAFAGGRDSTVHVLGATAVSSGIALTGEARSVPAIGADGTLYVATDDGSLAAFGP